jgi:hypothetical protein
LQKKGTRYCTHLGILCVDPSLPTPYDCAKYNGTWFTPAITKDSCQKQACRDVMPDKTYGSLYVYAQTLIDKKDCAGIEVNLFAWEQAVWAQPTIRSLNWTQNFVDFPDKLADRIKFNELVYPFMMNTVLGSSVKSVASSEALCDFSSTGAVLETVTCDCYGGNGDCFSNDFLVPIVVCKNS